MPEKFKTKAGLPGRSPFIHSLGLYSLSTRGGFIYDAWRSMRLSHPTTLVVRGCVPVHHVRTMLSHPTALVVRGSKRETRDESRRRWLKNKMNVCARVRVRVRVCLCVYVCA